MSEDRPEKLRQLFEDALRLPESERGAFLRLKCGSDRELLEEIEALLSQASSTSSTIGGLRLGESPATIATTANGTSTESSPAGGLTEHDHFGPYSILRPIGEGGMGTVYLAEQTQPIRRQVALKVVKLGMDTRQVIARFEGERQALAMMEHPHIAHVYDAGTSEKGRPYFVMEYVPGVAITQYCDERLLDTRERLKIFVIVCEALQHAHQKGVIHRDIKPSNILVFDQDSKPVPKVIDFGIAKATDQPAAGHTAFTQVGSLVGTPEYMSPEQANLTNPNVDTATDVYSLGVLLYELLAGALPFEGRFLRQAGLAELLRIIREEVPPTPSDRITELGETASQVARCRRTNLATLRRQLAGDLNWIVMKALEKDRSRRYASMSEFAADIQRHLSDEPVLAGPPNALYRGRKFARRHRIGMAASLLVVASLVGGIISTAREAHVARMRELTADAAVLQTEDPALALYLGWQVAHMGRPLPTGLEGVLATSLTNGPSYGVLSNQEAEAIDVSWSPDGKTLASAGDDGKIRLWEAATFKLLRSFQDHQKYVKSIAWSPDGRMLASAGDDRTVEMWEAASGQPIRTLQGHEDAVSSVAWSPDGKTLASASSDHTIRLWSAASGQGLRTLQGHKSGVFSIAWSPDGKTLASTSDDRTIRVWDVGTGQTLRILQGHQDLRIAWSPNGKTFASASPDGTVWLWEIASGRTLHTLRGHQAILNCVAWSPDGKTLASAGLDRTIRLWDPDTGQAIRTLQGHQNAVNSIAWSPDGATLASASADRTIRLWQTAMGQSLRTLHAPGFAFAWSPDGTMLASAGGDETSQVWDAATGQSIRALRGHAFESIAWSPDGRLLASPSDDKTIQLWNMASGQPIRSLSGHQGDIRSVAWSPDGKSLASASEDETVRLWDTASGQVLRILEGHRSYVNSVAWSPDGRTVASASFDNTVRLWDAASGRTLRTLHGHRDFVRSVAWSRDGKILASAGDDRTIRLWDAVAGLLLRTLQNQGYLFGIAWSPDGRTLASAGDPTIRLWDAATGLHLRTLQGHTSHVSGVAWSPNGKTLASVGDRTIRLWSGTLDGLLDQARRDIRLFTPSREDCQRYFGFDTCPPVR